MDSLGSIVKAHQGFSQGKTNAKNQRGFRPKGFLAKDLAKDAAEGLPEENPKAGLQYSPKESIRNVAYSSTPD